MDTAVALVQAYLNVNGYFTVAEYPVLEAFGADDARIVTDLDILAVRYAGAGHQVISRRHGRSSHSVFEPDALLRCPQNRPDMIVGEVKEGHARFNSAARNPAVLQVALARFGCCAPDHAVAVTSELLARGHTLTHDGHALRMVAFGDANVGATGQSHTVIPMRHVVRFLRSHLRQHWSVLRHAHFSDPTFGVLALMEKWEVDVAVSPQPVTTARPHGTV